MSEASVKLEVKPEIVRSIVQAEIQAAIVREFSKNPEQLISDMVKAALCEKVDSDGKRSQYSSYNTYDYLDVLLKKTIQNLAKESVQKFVNENRDKVEKTLMAEMKKSQKTLVQNFMKTILETTQNQYRINVEVKEKN